MAIAETLLISTVLPAALDFLKGMGGSISRKFFGMSVDDQIKLANADVERLKALAELDNPHGTPKQWVVDLRASFRYLAAVLVILVGVGILWAGLEMKDTDVIDMGFNLVGVPFCFIFGERLYLGLKGSGKK